MQRHSNIEMDVKNEEQDEASTAEQPANEDREMDEAEIFEHIATNDLPVSLDTAMALNLVYQEKVHEFLEKIDQKLEENAEEEKELKKELEAWNGFEWEREALGYSDALVRVPAQLYLPPYFRDSYNMAPKPNIDALSKRELEHLNPLVEPPRKWNGVEKNKLMRGIRDSLLEKELGPFKNKRDELIQQFKAAGDRVLDKLKAEVAGLDKKMDKITNKFDLKYVPEKEFESIDWSKISATDLQGTRTEMECRVAFFNMYHPWLNQDPTWSDQELDELRQLADKYNGRNWKKIALELGTGRTAFQCFEKYQMKLNPDILKKTWSQEEDEQLREAVETCRVGDYIPWEMVTALMEGRTRAQCQTRWTRKLNPTLKTGRWSPEEDEALSAAVQQYGSRAWKKISQKVPGRTESQCRDRWFSALKDGLKKGPWNKEEEEKLLEGIKQFGAGKWSKVSTLLDGRGPSACKARYRKLSKKGKKVGAVSFEPVLEKDGAVSFEPELEKGGAVSVDSNMDIQSA